MQRQEQGGLVPYLRKAQFYETDQMGIIHHANYVHWMEEARVDFMEQVGYGYERATEQGFDFVLMGIACEYKAMVRFGDVVRIDVDLSKLHPVMMTVRFTMTDEKTGKLVFTGESRHCCYDTKNHRPAALNKVLPELYAIFQQYFKEE